VSQYSIAQFAARFPTLPARDAFAALSLRSHLNPADVIVARGERLLRRTQRG
jgi:hypothetical protein